MSVDFGVHRQAYAYCAYCPKMCRFVCPVSAATRSEATDTWGKMSRAYLASQCAQPLDESGAQALYACTGCMRCRTHCLHKNEVGYALFGARKLSVEAQLSPQGVLRTLQAFAQVQNPFGKDLAELAARYRPERPVRFAFFPGCAALAKSPGTVADALKVSEAFGAPLGVCRAAGTCCGYPLYAAGELDAFRAHALQFARSLAEYPELVVLDPGCAYTLNVVYPRFEVPLRSRVSTVYEVLAANLANASRRPLLRERVVYHDPCHLGRGLGQYEQPRALLRAAVAEVAEGAFCREDSGCSGGGGLLPRSLPDVAAVMAERLGHELGPKGETVVSGCPTARRMLDRAGRPAEDLLSVLRRWLDGTPSPGRSSS